MIAVWIAAMRRVSPVVRLIGICLFMTFFATAQDTALKGKPELDPQSIIDDSNKLIERVRQAVGESGGDLSAQRVQWVFALSTGHYGKDPQGARAAREVAQYLVRELAAPEDSVTVRAWEMTLWDHLLSDNRRKILDDPADLEPQVLGRLWPTTPVKDSKGGHDTEKVIVDLVAELGNSRDAILVLITNTAASVAAKGTKLIGTNAADYLKTLEEWRRVEGDKDGATQKVNYLVAAAGKTTTSKLEVVVVLPKEFAASKFSTDRTRTEMREPPKLEAVEVPQEAPSGGSGLGIALLIGVLAAGVVAGIVYLPKLMAGSGGGKQLEVKFKAASAPGPYSTVTVGRESRGKAIRELVGSGPGFSVNPESQTAIAGFPAEVVAELRLSSNGKEVMLHGVSPVFVLQSVDGIDTSGKAALKPRDEDYQALFGSDTKKIMVLINVNVAI